MTECINREPQVSVVLLENLTAENVEREAIQEGPLVWPIASKASKKGPATYDAKWYKTHLKEY